MQSCQVLEYLVQLADKLERKEKDCWKQGEEFSAMVYRDRRAAILVTIETVVMEKKSC